jgi:hypothetical protein
MMRLKFPCVALALLLALSAVTYSGAYTLRQRRSPKQQSGQICPDPTVPCRTGVEFQPHDLPFRLSKDAVIWESEMFYAVVLKSMKADDANCEAFIPEEERLRVQALFPRQKVFSTRCVEPGELYYTNISANQRFMAVYAGRTRAEAARTLAAVKATGQFPGANLRRMRAAFNGT